MIENIEKEVLNWQSSTFPNATKQAIFDKLHEEVGELYQETFLLHSKTAEEIADVAIVSISLLNRMGTSLSAVIAAKLAINKDRTWGAETENGDRPRVRA